MNLFFCPIVLKYMAEIDAEQLISLVQTTHLYSFFILWGKYFDVR